MNIFFWLKKKCTLGLIHWFDDDYDSYDQLIEDEEDMDFDNDDLSFLDESN
jgi:hypothetical protein